ncbi:NAD(P)-binding domain-containing protein [Actinomadura rugatobispora]|uniref:NAD(P)-binding domain-containing protein n=1 Tax=Actinomadura rugatobispora TaxID=1994 RepID=A0ABW1AHR0_9ACTN|nr:hypothetical protein GCM10010200_084830 [Actinomadura rugatobispora]
MTAVALLGTGIMGTAMARNLLRHGFELRVWNRTRSRAEPLAADGATVAGSPAEAADDPEVVSGGPGQRLPAGQVDLLPS